MFWKACPKEEIDVECKSKILLLPINTAERRTLSQTLFYEIWPSKVQTTHLQPEQMQHLDVQNLLFQFAFAYCDFNENLQPAQCSRLLLDLLSL